MNHSLADNHSVKRISVVFREILDPAKVVCFNWNNGDTIINAIVHQFMDGGWELYLTDTFLDCQFPKGCYTDIKVFFTLNHVPNFSRKIRVSSRKKTKACVSRRYITYTP